MSATWFSRHLPPERRRRLLLLALLLVPIAVLTVLFREIARTVVVLPVQYLVWIAGVLWRSIPQVLIWGIVVVVALRVAIGSLLVRRRRQEELTSQKGEERWGRARIWTKWVELSDRGGYFRRRLARYLADLALDALAERAHMAPDQVQAELEAGQLDVPPRIRAYLLAALQDPSPDSLAWFRQLLRVQPAPLQVATEEIVDFLEANDGVSRGH